jgi:RNA polymerase sigma factor (sigma-70 family)
MRRQDRFDRLEKALDRLSSEQREVVLLARFHGCSLKEIARRIDKSPAAVGQILSRALRRLRAAFGDTESLHLPDRSLDDRESGK